MENFSGFLHLFVCTNFVNIWQVIQPSLGPMCSTEDYSILLLKEDKENTIIKVFLLI